MSIGIHVFQPTYVSFTHKGRAKTPPIRSPAGLRVLGIRQILLTSGLDASPTIAGDSRPRMQLSKGEHIVQIPKVGALCEKTFA